MRASSTLLSRRRYRSMIAVSKEIPLSLGTLSNIPGSGGKVTAVVAAAITLPLLIALVPGRLGQLLSLGLQQFVEGFLYAASYQLVDLTP